MGVLHGVFATRDCLPIKHSLDISNAESDRAGLRCPSAVQCPVLVGTRVMYFCISVNVTRVRSEDQILSRTFPVS